AWFGEERINWGLLMLVDALRRTLGLPRLDNTSLLAAVQAMGTWPGLGFVNGQANRAARGCWASSCMSMGFPVVRQRRGPLSVG
ncbi:hypothetical protein A248_28029, partial [Pseudomonas syringae pv. actinidiae ICMP 19100]